MSIRINTDGGARGNPGPAAAGFVAQDESGKIIFQKGKYLGRATNNQAEYEAVWMALNWLTQNFPHTETEFFLDSQLVVNQLNGYFKIKNTILKNKFSQIKNLIFAKRIKIKNFIYVPRSKNSAADNLVNKTLDTISFSHSII